MQVTLTGSLRSAVDGVTTIKIEARTIRDLFTKLATQYPCLQQKLDAGVAVSINGEIYRDNWGQEIPANAEVFLLPRIQGG